MTDTRTYWFKRDKQKLSDEEIFENLTRVIFQGGLSWDIIHKRWPNFQEAFANFSVDKVAEFSDDDFGRLIENEKIIRNSQKIEATLYNAKEFMKIRQDFGSFINYLNSMDKSDNYKLVIKEISKRFKRLGKKSSYIFLYSIGEDIIWDLPK